MSRILSQSPPAITDRTVLHSLIRQEWRLCRNSVISLAMVWVIGLWILVIFNHPAWLIAIGLLYVLIVSPAQAGHDVLDGTEEFSFSQPPGRAPLYVARLSIGLGFLLANGLLGGLAIIHNFPQRLWSIFFTGGLTVPYETEIDSIWYAMAVLLPCAAHSMTFARAATSHSRNVVTSAGMTGTATAVFLISMVNYLEKRSWRSTEGLAIPVLLAISIAVLVIGYRAYCRKDATRSGGDTDNFEGSLKYWILATYLGLLVSALAFWIGTMVAGSL
jgi:hypothetical protein